MNKATCRIKIFNPTCLDNDTVYIGAKSADDYWQIPYRGFYAVDAQAGDLEWQYQHKVKSMFLVFMGNRLCVKTRC
ncbi:hypothetical protein V4D06_03380 [Vibrio mimicus]|uniref:hypothetical protein n=1 Tax=Vibrio mimicus TaxID=674 RepID=UPI002F9575E0